MRLQCITTTTWSVPVEMCLMVHALTAAAECRDCDLYTDRLAADRVWLRGYPVGRPCQAHKVLLAREQYAPSP